VTWTWSRESELTRPEWDVVAIQCLTLSKTGAAFDGLTSKRGPVLAAQKGREVSKREQLREKVKDAKAETDIETGAGP
jgi:hypothetical protein